MEWYWAVIVINLIDVIINGVNLVCLCWHCAGPWREDGLPAWWLPGGSGLPVLHGTLPLQLSWRDGAESLDGWGEDQKQEFSTRCGHISCSFFILLIYLLLLLLLNGEGGRDGKHGIVDIVVSHSGKNKIFCILHEAAGQASLCFNCPKMYVHAGSQAGGALRTRLRFLRLHGQAHSGAGLEHPGVAQWWLLHRERRHRHSRVPVAADGGPARSGHQVDQEHGGDKG